MAHDATKVLLGTTTSSIKEVDNRKGTIAAGLIVRLKSDDTISIAAADGNPLGISLGRSLSDTARTAIARKGLRVPLVLTAAFTPTVGAQVNISDTTGKGIAAGAGATAMNATYASGLLTGIDEDGADALVALIDMPGGL
jgi:hypothetical protein